MKLVCIFFLIFLSSNTFAQSSEKLITVGLFNSIDKKNKLSSNPFISGSVGDWYFENRYNYEAENSASINFGKQLVKKIKGLYIIPTIGLVTGAFKGYTAETQVLYETKHLYISTDNQVSVEWKRGNQNFFFNWSILRYKITSAMMVGISGLYAKPFKSKSNADFGITASLKIKHFGISMYAFNYSKAERNYLVSLRYTFKLK